MNKTVWAVEGFIGNRWQQIAKRAKWKDAWNLFVYLTENELEHFYRVVRRTCNGNTEERVSGN